jgi:uncharacterized membrane protein HdeD (DUF308 family)
VTIVRAVAGFVTATIGVYTLADLPLHNPAGALVLGWTLLILGAAIFAPALLDLFEGDA